ncbi:AAA family ATPase [candidate division KSB3 bacterium]|uniref:AAA family ATPase n=1 Tax=candidate division KSB3 bacterium TaxID=2044937 RepID=A0A9D5JVK9_9BACT|nr:AAA family ATPase [candidate division KSB3 bacterium]MBD3324949.1 AAA family ATPase [candidate division KSB3 bacterium]
MTSHPLYMLTADELAGLTGLPVQDVLQAFDDQDCLKFSSGAVGIPPQHVKCYLSAHGMQYRPTIVAHINLKGGTGKTTSTITAATRAVQYGFTTCIVDMDSQGSASLAFHLMPDADEPIFCDVWQRPDDMVMDAIKPIQEMLSILPSSLENGLLDVQLMNPGAQKNAVRGVCNVLTSQGFDLVLIDCPPSLGTAVISTICAADIIVIPVCGDPFSLKGLELTLNEIASICDTFQLAEPKIRILYTQFDKRIKLSLETYQQLSAKYREYLIPTPIRTSSEFSKVLKKGRTVFASTRKSIAKEDYDSYLKHLLGMEKPLNTERLQP